MGSTLSLRAQFKRDPLRTASWMFGKLVAAALAISYLGGCTTSQKIDFIMVDSKTDQPIEAGVVVERSTKKGTTLFGGTYELSIVYKGEGPRIRNLEISSRDTLSFRLNEYREAQVQLDGAYVLVFVPDSEAQEPFNIVSAILENHNFDTSKARRVKIEPDHTARIQMTKQLRNQ